MYAGYPSFLGRGYPQIGPKDARDRREEARALLAKGIDPSEQRKAQKATQQSDQA